MNLYSQNNNTGELNNKINIVGSLLYSTANIVATESHISDTAPIVLITLNLIAKYEIKDIREITPEIKAVNTEY